MLPNYDLFDDFLPYRSMKATAGQIILSGVFSAARRNFKAYNARQMFLVENVFGKKSQNTSIYNNCCSYARLFTKFTCFLLTKNGRRS